MRVVVALLGIVAVAACKEERKAPLPSIEDLVHAEAGGGGGASDSAHALYTQRCALCHGEDGRGHGPAAATLRPPPRDFGDPAWQASVTDQQLAKIVVEGGPAVGKSASMPASLDLQGKPAVVAALVTIVRGKAPR